MSVPTLSVTTPYVGIVGVAMPSTGLAPLRASWSGAGVSWVAFAETSGLLPASLSWNTATSGATSATGYLTGTPLAGDVGTWKVSWTAENTDGISAVKETDLTIYALAITGPVSVVCERYKDFSAQLVTTSPATSFALVSGTLPSGVAFNPATGLLSGRSQILGLVTLGFTATNANGTSQIFSLTLNTQANMSAPTNNTRSNILGVGRFYFCPGATTPAQFNSKPIVDLDNVTAFEVQTEAEFKKHFGGYRGVVRRDKQKSRKGELGYMLSLDAHTFQNLLLQFRGKAVAGETRSALSSANGTAFAFATTAAVVGRWYKILDGSGNHVKHLTSVTIASKTLGTDFVVDEVNGLIMFLTAQSSNLTPVITAPAIAAGGVNYFDRIQPLQQLQQDGYGMLVLYDEDDLQTVVYRHIDFSCTVMINGNPSVGDDFAGFKVMVSVNQDVGLVESRDLNPVPVS